MRKASYMVVAVALAASAGLLAQAITVTIEIKPGDPPPKRIERRGGMLPVAILTTPEFDAATVDPDSVRLGPTGTEAGVFRSMLEDVDRDNDVDRLLLVRMSELTMACSDTEIRLKGKTDRGRDIEAAAPVQLEGCSGRP